MSVYLLRGITNVWNNNTTFITTYIFILEKLLLVLKYFKHKDIHLAKPEEAEKSLIDYIFVKKSNRELVKDVRVRRGPEISSGHFLVVTKIRDRWE